MEKTVKREFKTNAPFNADRTVKIKVLNSQMYHPECAPDGAVEKWNVTKNGICARCGKPIWSKWIIQ